MCLSSLSIAWEILCLFSSIHIIRAFHNTTLEQ